MARRTHHHPPPGAPARHPQTLLEDHIAANHRELQTLLSDNQLLAATHTALKQELSLAEHDLRQVAAAARKVKEEREAHVKAVYERSVRVEAEYRPVEAMNVEVKRVRGEMERLRVEKEEFMGRLKEIDEEMVKAKREASELPAIKEEIESLREDLHKGRAAIEIEKKTHAANLEQGRIMEKHMISMAREIKRLRDQLAAAEKRAREATQAAASNPSFAGGQYPVQYAVHQAQAIAENTTSGAAAAVAQGQQTHVQQ